MKECTYAQSLQFLCAYMNGDNFTLTISLLTLLLDNYTGVGTVYNILHSSNHQQSWFMERNPVLEHVDLVYLSSHHVLVHHSISNLVGLRRLKQNRRRERGYRGCLKRAWVCRARGTGRLLWTPQARRGARLGTGDAHWLHDVELGAMVAPMSLTSDHVAYPLGGDVVCCHEMESETSRRTIRTHKGVNE